LNLTVARPFVFLTVEPVISSKTSTLAREGDVDRAPPMRLSFKEMPSAHEFLSKYTS
jgi:hypothetical protein